MDIFNTADVDVEIVFLVDRYSDVGQVVVIVDTAQLEERQQVTVVIVALLFLEQNTKFPTIRT